MRGTGFLLRMGAMLTGMLRNRRRAARALLALPLVFATAACDLPGSGGNDTAAAPEVFTSIAAPGDSETDGQDTDSKDGNKEDADGKAKFGEDKDATSPERTSSKAPRPRDCASLPKDPRDMYPDGSAPGRMPAVSNGDYNFWIDDIENAYDPCAPISWIVFRGQLGDVNGVAGTAGSITDGIAIYVDGVPDGEMRIFGRIDDVYLDGDDTLRLRFSERTRSTAEGFTGNYDVTLEAEGGRVTAVSGDQGAFYDRWDDGTSAYMLGTYD